MAGNYVLLFFYSIVSGWILYYAYLMAKNEFAGKSTDQIADIFNEMMASPRIMIISMLIVVALTMIVCSIGLQKSVESVTKYMMLALLAIMVVLGIRSLTLPGGGRGTFLLPEA
jgi:NSS family neurotransmitter:Na+ symporter